eukprot:UC1_evm2s1840
MVGPDAGSAPASSAATSVAASSSTKAAGLGSSVDRLCDVQWQTLTIPESYLTSSTQPIRHAASDAAGGCLAVAGARGLAHYRCATRKWRMFGNVAQEKSMRCQGGLAWWRDHIVVATRVIEPGSEPPEEPVETEARLNQQQTNITMSRSGGSAGGGYHGSISISNVGGGGGGKEWGSATANQDTGSSSSSAWPTAAAAATSSSMSSVAAKTDALRSELRLYPRWTSLDNSNLALQMRLPAPAVRLAALGDYLVVLFSNCRARVYKFVTYVSGGGGAAAGGGGGGGSAAGGGDGVMENTSLPSSVVANIAGHLWVFPLDTPAETPALVATNAECHWTPYRPGCRERHLMRALWIACGRLGMKLWLPLYGGLTESPTGSGNRSGSSSFDTNKREQRNSATTTPGRDRIDGDGGGGGGEGECAGENQKIKTTSLLSPLLFAAEAAQAEADLLAATAPLTKRVMLYFALDEQELGYPLAVLFDDAVVLGARPALYCAAPRPPACSVTVLSAERRAQLYLHRVLRQLLRRGLSAQAMRVATPLASLPYFPHVLELLLHEVLEQEARSAISNSNSNSSSSSSNNDDGNSSSSPSLHNGLLLSSMAKVRAPSNALLPAVLGLIRRFPNHLDVLVHCARKTEVAQWPYLFDAAGAPDTLFMHAMKAGRLGTAASYLMVMQALTSPALSRRRALQLLDAALHREMWRLVRDLVRFLEATSEVTTPGATDGGDHSMQLSPRSRQGNGEEEGEEEEEREGRGGGGFDAATGLFSVHAFTLLRAGRLRALGRMATNLDFDLVKWLRTLRPEAVSVDNFKLALLTVAHDLSDGAPILMSMSGDGGGDAAAGPDCGSASDHFVNGVDCRIGGSGSGSGNNHGDGIEAGVSPGSTLVVVGGDGGGRIVPPSSGGSISDIAEATHAELSYMLNVLYHGHAYAWAF